MELILLKPGDEALYPGPGNAWTPPANLPAPWAQALQPNSCIAMQSVRNDMRQPPAGVPGAPVLSAFTCVKQVDRVSPRLYDCCLRATPLGQGHDRPTFIYILRDADTTDPHLITYQLRDATIVEIDCQANPGTVPTDEFKILFTEILWTYSTSTGRDAGNVSAGWSVKMNRPIAQFTS